MRSVDDDGLYAIGELARRTGLSVKTIRFYSDTGLVPPTDRTHLVLLEQQLRTLLTRRAVLRAVVKQDSTTVEMRLMHKIARMSDEERNRLLDEFWDEATEGLNINPEFIAWMRSAKSALPDDPSTEQLEAWIELAELVQDPGFRECVRSASAQQAELQDARREPATSPEAAKEGWELLAEISAARKPGASAEAARELIDRFVTTHRRALPEPTEDEAEVRHQLADRFEQHDRRLSRYWELLAVINSWPPPQTLSVEDTEWLVGALRAPRS